ncbi:MAG: hypothetical protein ACYCY2_05000 [Acidithiobacillus ferriphilus]|jgi:hypothetical protein|uniref:hypothetical protein n=1 Tax=Acidithiobacillus ferriphilus TaxID=1689834 RepID=UPI001C075255|nr:hypothetical protein [Acidithiobacillus ferriphilus]MBU2827480.1 hypothetical protein [Acidithiobacillus ferriphilus]MEB8474642.1 hypothetical protein [Acidithiobacillus ferriphilus]
MKKEITFALTVIVTSVALMGCSHAQPAKDTKALALISKPAKTEQHNQNTPAAHNINAGATPNNFIASMTGFANVGKKGTNNETHH